MRPVYVNGYSHHGALGDESALAAQVRAGGMPPAAVELPVTPGATLNYYSADVAPGCASAIARALAGSAVDRDLLRTACCFVGSSSAGVDAREAAIVRAGQVVLDSPYGLNDAWMRLRAALGLEGPYVTFTTACTSSANALLAAYQMIATGRTEHAIVVGLETFNLTTLAGFHALQLLTDIARPFDARRTGIVLGEAVSAVVLSGRPHPNYRLRILGGANHGDTTSPTGTDEGGGSIARAVAQALRHAGLAPGDIQLIKAQAAGSLANDRAEANGLHHVFSEMPAITSVKPYLGHTLGASGCAELTLLLSCFRAGFAPATLNCGQPDPALDVVPLAKAAAVPRYTLLNFFGFGGNNTALAVEFGAS